jgi:hypothetical protein
LGGAKAFAHVVPPSPLARKTGELSFLPVAPAASHEAVEQETENTEAEFAGRATTPKLEPPSVVATASPGKEGLMSPSGFGPTATQFCDDEHETENSWSASAPATGTSLQVTPESWLTSTPEPTAIQVVLLGHAKSATPAKLLGTFD